MLSTSVAACQQHFPACRSKVRMAGLCKVEMSASIGPGRADGGADCIECQGTRTTEGSARGEAGAFEPGRREPALRVERAAGAAAGATGEGGRGSGLRAPAARAAFESQDPGADTPADLGRGEEALRRFRTDAGG